MQKRRSRWESHDGWRVEPIILGGTDLLRVSYRGYVRDYCTSTAQVAQWVPLADLHEITSIG